MSSSPSSSMAGAVEVIRPSLLTMGRGDVDSLAEKNSGKIHTVSLLIFQRELSLDGEEESFRWGDHLDHILQSNSLKLKKVQLKTLIFTKAFVNS